MQLLMFFCLFVFPLLVSYPEPTGYKQKITDKHYIKFGCWQMCKEDRAGSENVIPSLSYPNTEKHTLCESLSEGIQEHSTHTFFSILYHSSQSGFKIKRQMVHNGSHKEDLVGGIHPQNRDPANELSAATISSLCTLLYSSTCKETADQRSQEQTTLLLSHAEHGLCSSIYTTHQIARASSHHQFLPTPVSLGFLR